MQTLIAKAAFLCTSSLPVGPAAEHFPPYAVTLPGPFPLSTGRAKTNKIWPSLCNLPAFLGKVVLEPMAGGFCHPQTHRVGGVRLSGSQ